MSMLPKRLVLCILLALAGVAGSCSHEQGKPAQPLLNAFAHNDYLHERPLHDALAAGFNSVEADVFRRGDSLYVAHDSVEIREGRTLERLYLQPLEEIAAGNGGHVLTPEEPLLLLVDIKSDSCATYALLHERLRAHWELVTSYKDDRVDEGAVRVVVSGNRPRAMMRAQPRRFATYDGRLEDVGAADPLSFLWLISASAEDAFGEREPFVIRPQDAATLARLVDAVHRDGRRIRFWGMPDEPGEARRQVWDALLAAGVDYLNTDDLQGLRRFLSDERAGQGN
jgi:hypothetical protein